MKIIIDDKIPYIKGALEPYADVEYVKGSAIDRVVAADADALIIRTRTRCNKGLLEGTSVKFIASATIGYDHIDTEYCTSNGIVWTNAPGCNSGSVMQYVTAAILHYASQNHIDLAQKVLGVVGVGNVGRKIVKMAEILGMQVLLNDPPRAEKEGPCAFISLEGILRESDIISFHVPLIVEGKNKTYHLADDDFFNRTNRGTLIINTSRGEIIDSGRLKLFLKNGHLAGSMLDVWENEPEIDEELLSMSFIGTPHIAGYSADGKANGTTMAVRSFSRFAGIGLDEWEPDDLPAPGNPVIFCNGLGKNFQEIATEIVLKTYDIGKENIWLKNDNRKFEFYRGNYPLRREFHAYSIVPENISTEHLKFLKLFGFKIAGEKQKLR